MSRSVFSDGWPTRRSLMRSDATSSVSTSVAARLLGVSADKLRIWESEGRVSATRTRGGHRRFQLDEIRALAVRTSGDRKHRIARYQDVGRPQSGSAQTRVKTRSDRISPQEQETLRRLQEECDPEFGD